MVGFLPCTDQRWDGTYPNTNSIDTLSGPWRNQPLDRRTFLADSATAHEVLFAALRTG